MNLLKDNHKYMRQDYYDIEDIPSRKRRLQGLLKECLNKYYITDSRWSDSGIKQVKHFNKNILPHFYNRFKSKDLTTRNFIRDLLKTKEESNILIAKAILESNEK